MLIQLKKSSVKSSTPHFLKSARRKLKSVKKPNSVRDKTENPDLLEFLKAREGLRKTSVKLYTTSDKSSRSALKQ